MKTFILAAIAAFGIAGQAHASEIANEKDANCGKEARAAILHKFKVPSEKLSYYGGALLGDGADSFEVDTYLVQVNGGILYKVDLWAEDCETFHVDRINN